MKSTPYYRTEQGEAYLGDSLQLMAELPDKAINLIVTSPPFALTRKKEYGNKSADEYVDWFLGFARQLRRILTDDGSLMIDLGGAYLPGTRVHVICLHRQVDAERRC
jgi:site-specific DNA-methyltransferase (cytosine-N4-specific)